MPADRAGYEARQAALLSALQRRAADPPGFDVGDLEAASLSLLRKRARVVAASWPALTNALGDQFVPEFARYIRTSPIQAADDGLADGFAFASSLSADMLDDHARTEMLLAGGWLRIHDRAPVPRRGVSIRALRLREPSRVLIILHLPILGRRHLTVALRRSQYAAND